MHRTHRATGGLAAALLVISSCSSKSSTVSDSGIDIGIDAGSEVTDAGFDGGIDAGFDAGREVTDGGSDAGRDGGIDAGSEVTDGGSDAGSEVTDGGSDAGSEITDAGFDGGSDGGEDLQPSWGSPHIGSDELATLTPVDPEGNAFTTAFTGCTLVDAGVPALVADFTLLASDGTTLSLDCTQPYPSTPAPLDVALPMQLTVTFPNLLPAQAQANAATLHFAFNDQVSTLPPNDSTVAVDARYLNTAPVLTIQQQITPTFATTLGLDNVFTPAFFVDDPDFTNDFNANMTVSITLDNTNAPGAGFNVSDLQPIMASFDTCMTGQVLTQTQVSLTCSIDAINQIFATVNVNPPGAAGTATLTATVNDNGTTGQCANVLLYTSAPCPLTDTVTASITYF